jgi:GNAT superfamily N-acetyltransferase
VWPRYNEQGDVLGLHWSRLDEDFRDFQFILYDDERGIALAQGHSIPCSWDGTVAGLPAGIDGAIDGAVTLFERGGQPNTLSALAIEIPPEHQGGGLARTMIGGMRDIAGAHGFSNLIAPLRPTWKERYPLTPIERYAAWTRDDGLPFDPWIRLHVRLGAEILQPVAQSLRITGTVREWEEWTETAFPESGSYVFPRGLALLEINREHDLGSYWEPNVWVRHSVG